MSVWVFKKDGEGEITKALIPPERLQQHLEAGYVVDLNDVKPSFQEADTNNTGLLSDAEVRAAAKKAGIKNAGNKKIETLKKELGYV